MECTIKQFIADAKSIMKKGEGVEQQMAIGERMKVLAKRDDLDRLGKRIGAGDGCTDAWVLHMEPDKSAVLCLAQFDPGYCSQAHNHGVWVVACGYRGTDTWKMYERLDDGSRPGYADLRGIGEVHLGPGSVSLIPDAPFDVHSHNNLGSRDSWEFVFLGREPDMTKRMLFDPVTKKAWRSDFRGVSGALEKMNLKSFAGK